MNLGGMRHNQGNSKTKQQVKEILNNLPSLHVANLPQESFFDLDLFKFFERNGFRIKNAKVALNKRTNRSLGYGYVQFFTDADRQRCLETLNNKELNGQAIRLTISSSNPRAAFEERKNSNLLVKNIAEEINQQELSEVFRPFGKILSLKLETNKNTKKSKGYAYIQFETEEEAANALKTLNGTELNGKKLEIDVLKKKEGGKTEVEKTVKPSKTLFVKNF
jgi:polyadenylate-binding protein